MVKNLVFILLLFCFSCRRQPVLQSPPTNDYISVLTQHNDNYRSGLNNHEKILTTSNVNGKQFGKLFTLHVDDQVYAQPLVVSNIKIGDSLINVLYVATVNNSVYAFNADNGRLYWKSNLRKLECGL